MVELLFTAVVEEYKSSQEFDPTKSESYKTDLYSYINRHLEQELLKLCPATLGEVHKEACGEIITTYSQVLSFSPTQISQYQLKPPEVTHTINCLELCQDFREDLEFRFSLGLFSLTVSRYNVKKKQFPFL